jgi:transposase
MSNLHLSPEALSTLRKQAVEAVIKHGYTQKETSKLFGFSPTSMGKYIREYRAKGESSFKYEKRGVKEGARSKISRKQESKLIYDILHHTPDEIGMEYSLWTSRVVKDYIEKEFGVTYARSTIRDLMRKLGFSSQKPIRLSYKRDPQKISKWLQETYPTIKARAKKEGARIYWGDEMGLQSFDNKGKTYGVKGETPTIKKSGSRFKCNMLAAISAEGVMNWMVFEDNFTAETFIVFLKRLVRQIKVKIFLIVDNHKVHHSKKVMNYVVKNKDKIELFYLPPYCPDMNPQELVNQDVKSNCNNFRPLRTMQDLTINLRYYLTQVQYNAQKLKNYFKKQEVAYAAL